jgi:hypothetical protein
MAYITKDNKMCYLGAYVLASDAAHVVDRVNYEVKRAAKKPNFASAEKFLEARSREMREIGVDFTTAGTLEQLNTTISEHTRRMLPKNESGYAKCLYNTNIIDRRTFTEFYDL